MIRSTVLFCLLILGLSVHLASQTQVLEHISSGNKRATQFVYSEPNTAFDLCADLKYTEDSLVRLGIESNELYQQIVITENLLGIISYNKSDFAKASEHYFNALKGMEKLGDTVRVAVIYNNIGGVYLDLDDYDKALHYFHKGLTIFLNTEDLEGQADAYGNIASVYSAKGEYEEGQTYNLKELAIRKETKDSSGLAITYHNLGTNYARSGEIDSALKYLNHSLNLKIRLEMENSASFGYLQLSQIYLDQNELEKAEEILLNSIPSIQSYENRSNELKAYDQLSQIYGIRNDHQNQTKYLLKKEALKDSIYSSEKNRLSAEYEFKYLSGKKENMIRILETENEFKTYKLEAKNKWIYTLSIGIALIFIFTLLLYIQYKNQKTANQLLVKRNVEITQSEEQLAKLNQKLQEQVRTKSEVDKYGSSTLDDETKSNLIKDILHQMEKEKIYRNNDLTLNSFAETISANRSYVSQIINDEFKKNFSSFVNEYRIKEARRILGSDRINVITIEAIALEVGFSSKSTFNAAFKKYTGITPTFYLNQLKNNP